MNEVDNRRFALEISARIGGDADAILRHADSYARWLVTGALNPIHSGGTPTASDKTGDE